MRILKVHNYYIRPGGEDAVFRAETSILRSAGHEVWEYLEYNEKIETMSRASVAIQTLWSNVSYRRLKKFLQEVKPEVVHFHNTFPLISPSAYYACQDLNIPVVQTLDNQRLICPASTFYRNEKPCLDCLGKTVPWPGVLHACYHDSHVHTAVVASMVTLHKWLGTWKTKVDTFLCSTSFYRDLFVQAGFPADKIVVMPHFVQQQPWFEMSESAGDYALFAGRLDPEKGINTLLEAWRFLDVPLMIRGEGRMEEWAREFVKKHGLKNIKFPGRMSERELSELIGNARFLIMPSEGYYETFGLVIIEAHAHGIPVIASNLGVVPELVSDGHSGLLFKTGNPQDLAQKVEWMWSHPAQAKEMGRNGRAVCLERFTQDRCYETLIEVYGRLINSR
jgi:glycosyltransferase involved in cell wall biosynthesis